MGNFHCIPSGCAKVVYRQYLAPVIRWRYPGEDWIVIDADQYTFMNQPVLNPTSRYFIYGTFYSKNSSAGGCNSTAFWRTDSAASGNQFTSIDPILSGNSWGFLLRSNYFMPCVQTPMFYYDPPFVGRFGNSIGLQYRDREATCLNVTKPGYGLDVIRTKIIREDGQPVPNNCKFTVYKNGAIVHEEIRDLCPEVEQLPCRLSDEIKEIKIDKLPHTHGVEVVPFGRDNFFTFKGLKPQINLNVVEIPQHCLNIYDTYLAQSIFNSIFNQDLYLDYEHIAQICSSPSCPPPEYQVICNCDCESCPDDTCAVNCDGHICCYDTDTGIAVKQIAIVDYCGEGTL